MSQDYPTILTLTICQFKYAENPDTRRKASESYEARLKINVPLFEKTLELRRKIASELGYATWADYITEVKMAKSASGVTKVSTWLPRRCRGQG